MKDYIKRECGGCEASVYVADESANEFLDSVWMSRDQSRTPQPLLDSKLSEEKSGHTQDSELSLTLLCYTESKPTDAQDTTVCDSNQGLQDEESTDQTSTESLDSVWNAGEQQQILQTKPKMCSDKLIDCRNLMMKIKTEPTEIKTERTAYEYEDNLNDGHDCIPSDVKSALCLDGEILSSTSKERRTAQTQEKKLNLKDHREKKKKQFHCQQCGKVCGSSSNLKVHMRTHSGEKYFYCTECGNYFSSKQSLDVHRRIHTGEKAYVCPYCEITFRQKYHLQKHVFIHTNERPYQCSECGKTFRDSFKLKSHQNIHSKEKPYQCSHCDKSFIYKYRLIVHERLHTGEKPYHCTVCGKSFNQCEHLVSHQRIHTGEKPYKCCHCEKTFARSDYLKTHERFHTGEKPYVCSTCGERFFYSRCLRNHQKKHTEEQTTLKLS
ncbi:uncharacterized protein [Paramisgurnus dabryanus]|uniref:uncharacterized protein n=1 Tax=Paramisgurnus dabryanus TaxID=90735 RepID=UPI0031F431F7